MSCWLGIHRAPPEFLDALKKACEERGWDYESLLGHISHESKFDSAARSGNSSARGLIQMLDSTAKRFAGMSSEELRTKSHMEQLPGILAYFDAASPHKFQGADYLLWGISTNRSLLSASDSRVIHPAGSKEALANPGLVDTDGNMTVGFVRKAWDKWVASDVHVCVPSSEPPKSAGISGVFMPIIAVTALYLWSRRR